MVVGAGADKAIPVLAEHGAAKVYVADAAEPTSTWWPLKVAVLAEVAGQASPAAILIASSADGKEIAGRLAVRLGTGAVTDAVGIAEDLSATQSILAAA